MSPGNRVGVMDSSPLSISTAISEKTKKPVSRQMVNHVFKGRVRNQFVRKTICEILEIDLDDVWIWPFFITGCTCKTRRFMKLNLDFTRSLPIVTGKKTERLPIACSEEFEQTLSMVANLLGQSPCQLAHLYVVEGMIKDLGIIRGCSLYIYL
jgi:hypothetical protein